MDDAFTEGEVCLLLKSMLVILSDECSVKQTDIKFLKEFSSMGEPFNSIDFETTIDNCANSYNTQQKTFFQDFICDLRGYKLHSNIGKLLINLDISILEQGNLTYERLSIIKTIRSQINCTDSQIPAYRQIRNTQLPFEYALSFKDQFGIDDSTFGKIANEHFIESILNVLEASNAAKNHSKETHTGDTILKKRKWWQKLIII